MPPNHLPIHQKFQYYFYKVKKQKSNVGSFTKIVEFQTFLICWLTTVETGAFRFSAANFSVFIIRIHQRQVLPKSIEKRLYPLFHTNPLHPRHRDHIQLPLSFGPRNFSKPDPETTFTIHPIFQKNFPPQLFHILQQKASPFDQIVDNIFGPFRQHRSNHRLGAVPLHSGL